MASGTRAKLLAAAERILLEQGVHALTVRRVGDVSGQNPTLITYHFGTVAALLQELCDENLAPMLAGWKELDDPVPGKPPVDGQAVGGTLEDGMPDDRTRAVTALLERWLRPLVIPAAFNPKGRALVVVDEIAQHGESEIGTQVVAMMVAVAANLADKIGPYLPHLPAEQLRIRLRLIAGAALGPPPRARLSGDEPDPAMGEDALTSLVSFARAALSSAA